MRREILVLEFSLGSLLVIDLRCGYLVVIFGVGILFLLFGIILYFVKVGKVSCFFLYNDVIMKLFVCCLVVMIFLVELLI